MGKKVVILILALLCLPMATWAADNTAAAFSRTNVDAKSSGMGMAGTTTAVGGNTVAWNPALLATLDRVDVDLMSTTLFETTYISAFLAGKNWGIGYTNANLAGIPETTRDSNGRSATTGTAYNFTGNVIYLATGFSLIKDVDFGATAKYIHQSIATTNASGIGVDIALNYHPLKWLTTSLVAENFIPPTLTWNTADASKEVLPLIIRGGVRFDIISGMLVLATDLVKEQDRNTAINIGVEYTPISLAAFRAGLHNGRVTLGTGLMVDGLRLDASWETPIQTNLDDMYRFGIGLTF